MHGYFCLNDSYRNPIVIDFHLLSRYEIFILMDRSMFCAGKFYHCRTNLVILLLTGFTWTIMPLVTGVELPMLSKLRWTSKLCGGQLVPLISTPSRTFDRRLLKRRVRRSIRPEAKFSTPDNPLNRAHDSYPAMIGSLNCG